MPFELSNEYNRESITVNVKTSGQSLIYTISGGRGGVKINLVQKENGDLFLDNFRNETGRKGYGRKVLCALMHHIIQNTNETTRESLVELLAEESDPGTIVGEGLISQVYAPMGFTFDDDDEPQNLLHTGGGWPDWYEVTHERGGYMYSTVGNVMDYCVRHHRPRPRPRSRSRSRPRSRQKKRRPRSRTRRKGSRRKSRRNGEKRWHHQSHS